MEVAACQTCVTVCDASRWRQRKTCLRFQPGQRASDPGLLLFNPMRKTPRGLPSAGAVDDPVEGTDVLNSNRYNHLIGTDILPARFWQKIEVSPDGCWLWTATRSGGAHGGYAYLWAKDGTTRAHRIAYLSLVGPTPEDLVLDHLCRVRHCVNPAHLEPVTQQVNLLRGETRAAEQVRRTHCTAGHEYTPENTMRNGRKRQCRACHNQRTKLAKRAAKAAAAA